MSPSAGCSSTGLTTHRSQIAQPRRTLLQRSSSQLQKHSYDRLLFKFGTLEQTFVTERKIVFLNNNSCSEANFDYNSVPMDVEGRGGGEGEEGGGGGGVG